MGKYSLEISNLEKQKRFKEIISVLNAPLLLSVPPH